MSYEDAIKWLENLKQDIGQLRHEDLWPYAQAIDEICDLLEEQKPKPIAYTDNPYTGLPVARCPKCGKFARQFHSAITEETHYCPWCGQAVLWHNE